MTLVVDPKDVSFDAIATDFLEYVKSKPDYAKWKDFYESGSGVTITELMAGLATYLRFSMVANRRETYLHYAEHVSSSKAIAQTLGYSAFRGKNPHLRLTVNPTSTQVLKKMDIIGEHQGQDIVALADYTINLGQAVDVDVALGPLKTEDVSIESADLKVFRFTSPNVSDDILLTLNGDALPVSNLIPDLLDNYYVTLSNAMGAVDVMYLNNVAGAANTYNTGDVLQLRYVELSTLVQDHDELDFFYGDIQSVSTLDNFTEHEKVGAIKVNAPLHHETQLTVRSREDYPNLLLLNLPGAVDANSRDVSPAVVSITYVKDDLSLLTEQEKADVLVKLDKYRPFGIDMAGIEDPIQVDAVLDVTLTLKVPFESVGQNQIDTDVDAIMNSYESKLGASLDLEQIEHELEDLGYLKIARVEISNSVLAQLAWNEYYQITTNIISQ